MNSYEIESYEDFLQAISELYDQNKLDFNNYKLLKNEIKKLESNHNQDIKNLKKFLNVLKSKIKNNVQSNWNETNTSSDAYIKNKPTLSTVATSGSYNDLNNKPIIPTVPSNLVTGSSNSYIIWTGTQSQYDSITTKDNNTLYFIKEG